MSHNLRLVPLSSAEASYSRALGKNIPAARGGWEEEKLKPSFPALPFSLSSTPAPVSFAGVY